MLCDLEMSTVRQPAPSMAVAPQEKDEGEVYLIR